MSLKPLLVIPLITGLISAATVPASAQVSDLPISLHHRQAGGLELLCAKPGIPLVSETVRHAMASYPEERGSSQPSFVWPVIGGLASKVGGKLIFLLYDLDIWHAAPAVFLLDPLMTAFGVHVGNRYHGSFVLDLLTSYTSFYIATYVAYGTFFGAGILEDEPENWNGLYASMGVQLLATVVVERLIGGRKR